MEAALSGLQFATLLSGFVGFGVEGLGLGVKEFRVEGVRATRVSWFMVEGLKPIAAQVSIFVGSVSG